MSFSPPDSATRRLLADADLCVKCGLCLPHCPTYLDTQHEGDSPRGRIALVQGLANGLIEPGARMEQHLDGCLSCRKCEVVCPAKVPYSRILDAGRARLTAARPARSRLTRLIALGLVSPLGRALLRFKLGLYRGLGLQALLRRLHLLGHGRLAHLESLLPGRAATQVVAWSLPVPADAPRVSLFRGCATDLFERDALDASALLLRAAGYSVDEPKGQACCGALHQHGGLPQQAAALARQNLGAFAGTQPIASCTSGCAATLKDYGDLAVEGGAAFAARVQDIAALLLPRIGRLKFHPLPLRVALHRPCTASNVMLSDAALLALLARVPQLQVLELDPTQRCCGAAGSHFITHGEEADRLLARKLDAVEQQVPDRVLSANIGCSLHLAGGLRRAGRAQPPVQHPAVLLAQQLVR